LQDKIRALLEGLVGENPMLEEPLERVTLMLSV